jgi:hypothetical protein
MPPLYRGQRSLSKPKADSAEAAFAAQKNRIAKKMLALFR